MYCWLLLIAPLILLKSRLPARNSGQTYWWILPYVNIQLFNKVLADFAQHFGIGEKKQVVLVVDKAGWYSSTKVKIPQGIQESFYLLTLQNYNQQSVCGHSRMNRLLIEVLKVLTRLRRYYFNVVVKLLTSLILYMA